MAVDPFFLNVSLLLHGDGVDGSTVVPDSSPRAKTITAHGTAALDTTQAKFGPSSINFTGAMASFVDAAVNEEFKFGTGDFTIEAWVYIDPTEASSSYILSTVVDGGVGGDAGPMILWININDTLRYYTPQGGFLISAAIAMDVWLHVAISRASGTTRLFINGVSQGSVSDTADFSAANSRFFIGDNSDGTSPSKAWLDEVRVTKGVARYIANFTPPTEAFPESTGAADQFFSSVVLLAHCDGLNNGILFPDNSNSLHTLTANGGAVTDTGQKKFGTASCHLPATTDSVSSEASSDTAFPADFTVETFIRPAAGGLGAFQATIGATDGGNFWLLRITNGNVLIWQDSYNGVIVTGAITLTGDTWQHIAASRRAGTLKLFVDGIEDGSAAYARNLNLVGGLFSFGALAGASGGLNGWLDDVRVTKGIGRYSANFTPPSIAFPNSEFGSDVVGGGVYTTIFRRRRKQ